MSISLKKGDSISLKKDTGKKLSKIILAAGWDPITSRNEPKKKSGGFLSGLLNKASDALESISKDIDLDASAIMYSGGSCFDAVYFGNLKSRDGAVKHSGDNLTGDGDGDDEQIVIDLDRVSAQVDNIVFVINSYSGQRFNEVCNVFARVVDSGGVGNTEIVRYDLEETSNNRHTGIVIARLKRNGNDWNFEAVGKFHDGKTYKDMIPFSRTIL